MLDSTSRRVARRFAPQLVHRLAQDHPHHRAFIFQRHHTVSSGTTKSVLIPMFHGGILDTAPAWCYADPAADVSPRHCTERTLFGFSRIQCRIAGSGRRPTTRMSQSA